MKKLFLLPLALGLSFCNCQKSTIPKNNTVAIESECPENGKCTIQIFRNKNMEVKTDEFGSIYQAMNDDSNKSVVVYQYNRNVEEGLQDGQHREEIIFEINNSDAEIQLSDKELQETKMLFGRHCYCKGQAGNFKVEKGTLNLTNKAGIVTVALDFQITKVPQLFTTVRATVK